MERQKLKISLDDLISEMMKSNTGLEHLIKNTISTDIDNKTIIQEVKEEGEINILDHFLREKSERIKTKWSENVIFSDKEKEMYQILIEKLETVAPSVMSEVNKYTKRNWFYFYSGSFFALLSYFLVILFPNIFNINFFIVCFLISMPFAIKGGISIAELTELKIEKVKNKIKNILEEIGFKEFNYIKFQLTQLEHNENTDEERKKIFSKIIGNMRENETSKDFNKVSDYLLPMITNRN